MTRSGSTCPVARLGSRMLARLLDTLLQIMLYVVGWTAAVAVVGLVGASGALVVGSA
ncbi:hypothetical protein ACN26Y_02795 [Micromonospora sp. WMMD558]|uniref:hypothetical protein n=1 Tax=Micromonospora sp. WMMD558 TaxID=3403462 RepID=UPI003BF57BF0